MSYIFFIYWLCAGIKWGLPVLAEGVCLKYLSAFLLLGWKKKYLSGSIAKRVYFSIRRRFPPGSFTTTASPDCLLLASNRFALFSAWLCVTLTCTTNVVRKPQFIRLSGWWLVEMETDGWETWWWHCLLSGITKSLMEVRIHTSPYRLPTVQTLSVPKNTNWRVPLLVLKQEDGLSGWEKGGKYGIFCTHNMFLFLC